MALRFAVFAVHCILCAAASASGRPTLAPIDEYLSTTDLLWGWDAGGSSLPNGTLVLDPLAPVNWYQAAYIGNGLVGVLLTATQVGPTTPALRLDVSRTDVWGPCENRLPTGYFTLEPLPSLTLVRVDARLDVGAATLRVNLTLSSGAVATLSLLVSAADPLGPTGVILGHLSQLAGRGGEAGPPPLSLSFTPDTEGPCSNSTVARGSIPGAWGAPTEFATQSSPSGTFTLAYTTYPDGDGTTLVASLANSQRSATNASSSTGDALASVAASVAAGAPALSSAHAAWWSAFWRNTSFFSFSAAGPGTTALEAFAHIAGYRYASAARFTMSDLMGPWGPAHATTCIGPWCQYCWDMNQQVMLYLPTPSNRGLLLGAPAFDMVPAATDGSWTHRYGSNAPGGGTNELWWLAQLHRFCLYHGDDARLTGALLPALRQQLLSNSLRNGSDGLLHVYGCKSPEYPMSPSTDCSYDLMIYRWAAQTAQALALLLDPSDPALPVYADIVKRLAPYPVDPATCSWEVAAGVPFAQPHRHYSHILAMYDLATAGALPGEPATMAATLDVWWNITCAGPQAHGPDWAGDDECRGFTQAAMGAMSNTLNRTHAALGNLTAYLRLVGLPNGMYGEEVYAGNPSQFSPVSESAYSAAASVYGMLLQARGGESGSLSAAAAASEGPPPLLRVWPAAPFANASFFRLRAEGALLVSAVRVEGATQWIAIEADTFADGSGTGSPINATLFCGDWASGPGSGLPLTVVTDGPPAVSASPLPGTPGAWAISGLLRGDAAAFYPAGSPGPVGGAFNVAPADGRNATEFNAWGSRFVYRGELP